MAQLTITVPDAILPRLREALGLTEGSTREDAEAAVLQLLRFHVLNRESDQFFRTQKQSLEDQLKQNLESDRARRAAELGIQL